MRLGAVREDRVDTADRVRGPAATAGRRASGLEAGASVEVEEAEVSEVAAVVGAGR